MLLREIEGVAPDLVLQDARRGPVRLSEYWQAGPAVLIFLRHFGGPLCREHRVQVQADLGGASDLRKA